MVKGPHSELTLGLELARIASLPPIVLHRAQIVAGKLGAVKEEGMPCPES